MDIRTKEIKLTPNEYFKILTLKYFRQKWWLFVLIAFIVVSNLAKDNKQPLEYFLTFLALSYPLYLIYYFWSFAYSKENKIIYLGHSYQFEENQVVVNLEDGTQSEINLDYLVKSYKTKDYAMFYNTKVTCFYLPKNSFENPDDFQRVVISIEKKIYANNHKEKK